MPMLLQITCNHTTERSLEACLTSCRTFFGKLKTHAGSHAFAPAADLTGKWGHANPFSKNI